MTSYLRHGGVQIDEGAFGLNHLIQQKQKPSGKTAPSSPTKPTGKNETYEGNTPSGPG